VKIAWADNPLNTKVVLDEHDRQVLRLKVKVDDLLDRIGEAVFALDSEHQDFLAQRGKGLSAPEALVKALKVLDLDYLYGDAKKGDRLYEDRIDELLGYHVEALLDPHHGDCTCDACPCMKCHAERLLDIRTCPGLGNHEANYIRLAFQSTGPDGPDGPQGTAQQAIAYLRDYKPTRSHHYESWSDEQWSKLASRWSADATRAHDWLVAYSRDPSPSMRDDDLAAQAKLTLRKSQDLSDWYVIERVAPDVAELSDAAVEGTQGEMLAIADAIDRRTSVNFSRCGVCVAGNHAFFYSPRHSGTEGRATLAVADDLAAQIRAAFKEIKQ